METVFRKYLKECYRCGKVGPCLDSCGLCGSLSVHLLPVSPAGDTQPTAYSLAAAACLDVFDVDVLSDAGCAVRVVIDGTATAYEWNSRGEGELLLLAFGEIRGCLDAAGVDTAGDVVRLALADWHTWGGRRDVLPASVGSYRVELVKVVR